MPGNRVPNLHLVVADSQKAGFVSAENMMQPLRCHFTPCQIPDSNRPIIAGREDMSAIRTKDGMCDPVAVTKDWSGTKEVVVVSQPNTNHTVECRCNHKAPIWAKFSTTHHVQMGKIGGNSPMTLDLPNAS